MLFRSIQPHQIDYINAHGTSTPANDAVETLAIKLLFGEDAYSIPVSSTKSMIGHTLGAAGAIESVATILMLDEGFVHPSVNCEDLHPDLAAYEASVPHTVRELPDLRTAIKAGFGFGDVNACVVYRKWEDRAAGAAQGARA